MRLASRERAKRRRRRRLIVGLVATLVVAAVMGVLGLVALAAYRDEQEAREAAEQETNRRVATQLQTAASAYTGGLPLQALLVRAADVLDETPIGAVEMLATVERDPPIARRIDATERNVGFEAATLLDDGRVVIGDGEGGLAVWHPGDSEAAAATNVGHGVLAIASRPGSSLIAVAGGNVTPSGRDFVGNAGWVDLVDASDPKLTPLRLPLATDQPISTALFDGRRLIVGSWDGTIGVFDLADPAHPVLERTLPMPGATADRGCVVDPADRRVRALAIDDAGRWLAAGANDCTIGVWDRATLAPITVLQEHTSKVRALAFVPGSAELLSTGDDRTIRSWDLSAARAAARLLVAAADTSSGLPSGVLEGRLVTLCVSPDGSAIVAAGRDHRVWRWVRDAGAVRADPAIFSTHTTTVRGVLCPTPTTFVSVAGDGLVVWDLTRPKRWGRMLLQEEQVTVGQLAVRPDISGEVAVSASGTLTVFGPDGAGRQLDPSGRTRATSICRRTASTARCWRPSAAGSMDGPMRCSSTVPPHRRRTPGTRRRMTERSRRSTSSTSGTWWPV